MRNQNIEILFIFSIFYALLCFLIWYNNSNDIYGHVRREKPKSFGEKKPKTEIEKKKGKKTTHKKL